MLISVALDGSKRRNITVFQGDTVTITVAVYEHDGDAEPIAVTDARFVETSGNFVYGEAFTVSSNDVGQHWFRLVGEIGGVTTTLAFGYLTVEGEYAAWYAGCHDGYWVNP